MDLLGSVIKGALIGLGASKTIQMEVLLPAGIDTLDLHKVLKDATEEAGCTLVDFKVVEKEGA